MGDYTYYSELQFILGFNRSIFVFCYRFLQKTVRTFFLCFLKKCPKTCFYNVLVGERGIKPTSRCKEGGEILGTFTISEKCYTKTI